MRRPPWKRLGLLSAALLLLTACGIQSDRTSVARSSFTATLPGGEKQVQSTDRIDPQGCAGLFCARYRQTDKTGVYTEAVVIAGQEASGSSVKADLKAGTISIVRSDISGIEGIRTRAEFLAYLSSQVDTDVASIITAAGSSVKDVLGVIADAWSGAKLAQGAGAGIAALANGRAEMEALRICTADPSAAPACAALLGRQ